MPTLAAKIPSSRGQLRLLVAKAVVPKKGPSSSKLRVIDLIKKELTNGAVTNGKDTVARYEHGSGSMKPMIVGDDAMDSSVCARLKAVGLERQEDPVLGEQKRASVLIPLTQNGCIILTQRPSTLRTHAGEVCFPGGKQDAEDDGDDIRTALRETREEIGLTAIEPLCRFPAVESYHGLCVTPVVGLVENRIDDVDELQISENEVAAVFLVPLSFFADDGNLSEPVKSIEWRGGTFAMRTYQYEFKGQTFTIWGLTAYIAHQAACIALTTMRKGYLYLFDSDRSAWRTRYFEVEGNSMLHFYDSERTAANKHSASKKNRLPLKNCQADVDEAPSGRFGLLVQALEGRVVWRLAAATEIDRQQWIVSLRMLGHEEA